MIVRQPPKSDLETWLPRMWMFTDDRMGDALWPAVRCLPAGTGVVVRHYAMAHEERMRLGRRIVALARQKGLIVLWAGTAQDANRIGANGVHTAHGQRLARRSRQPALIRSVPVHSLSELRTAQRCGADVIFISPVFATRSHAGTRVLGPMRAAALARASALPAIALGGMVPLRAYQMRRLGLSGWAGIDAFIR